MNGPAAVPFGYRNQQPPWLLLPYERTPDVFSVWLGVIPICHGNLSADRRWRGLKARRATACALLKLEAGLPVQAWQTHARGPEYPVQAWQTHARGPELQGGVEGSWERPAREVAAASSQRGEGAVGNGCALAVSDGECLHTK